MCSDKIDADCPICLMLKAFDSHPMGKHLRSAQREFLMAMRSVLDSRISALEDQPERGAQKVDIQ